MAYPALPLLFQRPSGIASTGAHTEILLPEAIIYKIASFSDELAVWRMMFTSRAWREGAERALRPYLKQAVVTMKPAIVESALMPYTNLIPARIASLLPLHNRIELYLRHILHYSSPIVRLRELTLEIHIGANLGHSILQLVSPYLEKLEIHLMRETWLCGYPRAGSFGLPFPLSTIAKFNNLTTLAIVNTTGCFRVVRELCAHMPELRNLNLNCICLTDPTSLSFGFQLPKLRCLTVVASPNQAAAILTALLRVAPDLIHLVIHHRAAPSVSPEANWFHYMFGTEHCPKNLSGLAVYGCSHPLIDMLPSIWSELEPGYGLISELVLEQQDSLQYNFVWFPLLTETPGHLLDRPILPALRSITWVRRRVNIRTAEPIMYPPFDPTQERELFHPPSLFTLFEHYPSLQQVQLQQVQFVSEYPQDPFLSISQANPVDPNILCVVPRPLNGWMTPTFPSSTPNFL